MVYEVELCNTQASGFIRVFASTETLEVILSDDCHVFVLGEESLSEFLAQKSAKEDRLEQKVFFSFTPGFSLVNHEPEFENRF